MRSLIPLPDLIIIVTSVCVLTGRGVSVPSPKSIVSSVSDSGGRTASVIGVRLLESTVLIGRQPSREYIRSDIDRSEATPSIDAKLLCDSRDHQTSGTTRYITYVAQWCLWKTCAHDVHMVWRACGNTRDVKKYLPTLQQFARDPRDGQRPSHIVSLDSTCRKRKMRPLYRLNNPRLSGNLPRGRS